MQSNLILTAAQAQAVYSAICALGNVGADIKEIVFRRRDQPNVRTTLSGGVVIDDSQRGLEHHHSVAAFAAAYGLAGMPDLPGLVETATDALRLIGKLDPAHPNAVAVHQRLGMALKVAA